MPHSHLTKATRFPLPLSLTTLFSNNEQLSLFISYLKLIHLSTDEFLFRCGDLSDGIYLILSGQVSAVIEQSTASIQRLQTFGVGEIIGEEECFFEVRRSVSFIVEQPSSLYHLSNQAWGRLEQEAPAIATELHYYLLGLFVMRCGFVTGK